MATCPECQRSSRDDPTLMEIKPALVAANPIRHSLAGVQLKVSARSALRLSCRCGWSVIGRITGGEFVVDDA